jgi:predicted AAA+ superfamily ATPase
MYVTRTIEPHIQRATQQFPVVWLTGARQVGKTTLLKHISADTRSFVTLDDPLVLNLAKTDPALFLQRFPPPVLIDEVQYAATELFPYVKMAVDRDFEPGMFWLTGSQQFHLMQGISESLAGRVAVMHLFGLSRRELLGQGASVQPFLPAATSVERNANGDSQITLPALYRLIWRGTLPAIATNDAIDRDLFYSSYTQTYLQRDVRDLARVGDEMAFLRFLRATAARTGQILNLADLARDADVTPNTAKHWLSILQTAGMVYLLAPYHANISKRLVKTPKLYFLETGLAAYLTGWSSPETLEAGAMSGALLETWVVAELLKGYWHSGRQPDFYYYRDKDQREIDLLILQDGVVFPLEIKKTASPRPEDVRHFQALARLEMPVGPGGLICLAQQSLPLTATTRSIPVGAI